jgi:hypothetical protein
LQQHGTRLLPRMLEQARLLPGCRPEPDVHPCVQLQEGTALLMHLPASPGLRGAAHDCLRVALGGLVRIGQQVAASSMCMLAAPSVQHRVGMQKVAVLHACCSCCLEAPALRCAASQPLLLMLLVLLLQARACC